MTPISNRYHAHLAVLFALTLVPILVHSYARVRRDDCANPAGLAELSEIRSPDAEHDREIRSRFDAEDWWTGPIAPRPSGTKLEYAVVRSYNSKRLYYRPAHRLIEEATPQTTTIEWLAVEETMLPIHRPLYPRSREGDQRTVAYIVVYEDEPVANGYLAQLKHAPEQLLRGSRPTTLFIVWGQSTPDRIEAIEERAREWLVDAWHNYRTVCAG